MCRLYTDEKMKVSDISKTVKRDNSTVRKILQKNNVYVNSINYMTDKEWNNIVSDYKNGMTPKELSLKYNRSDGYLINKLKEKGIFIYQTLRLSDEQWNEITELYKQGKNNIIFEKYPTLSLSSLYCKMSELNTKSGLKKYWSDEDMKIVKERYLDTDLDVIYKMIDKRHTKDAIETLANKKFGYNRNKKWTEEENNILINNYSLMTAEELQKLLPNRSIEAIRDRGIKYKLKSKYRLETYWKDFETDYLLENWDKLSDYEIGLKLGKTSSSVKERRNLLGLYRMNKNKQGYTTIKNMLRGKIWEWKKASIKSCNYECVLTGSKNFEIHHLYGFSDIFNEYLEIHPLKSMNVSDYTKQELDEICASFVDLHNEYPLGVCIHPDLHILFHSMYGKHNNTVEQWNDFKNNYINQ